MNLYYTMKRELKRLKEEQRDERRKQLERVNAERRKLQTKVGES